MSNEKPVTPVLPVPVKNAQRIKGQKAKVPPPPRIDDDMMHLARQIPRAMLVLMKDERYPLRNVIEMKFIASTNVQAGGLMVTYVASGQSHQRYVSEDEMNEAAAPTPKKDALESAFDQLDVTAAALVGGKLTPEEAGKAAAEIITEHGPENVRTLDAYFVMAQAKLRGLKMPSEAALEKMEAALANDAPMTLDEVKTVVRDLEAQDAQRAIDNGPFATPGTYTDVGEPTKEE